MHLRPYDVLLLRPGGVGSTPLWLGVGLVVAALVPLGMRGGRRVPVAAWAVGLVALAVGVAQGLMHVHVDALPDP